jgi:cell division transport system permease protein
MRSRMISDLPLTRDLTTALVPWVIGLMVYLGILAMIAALNLQGILHAWKIEEKGAFTIEVSTETEAKQVLDFLKTQPILHKAVIVPEEAVRQILGRWIDSDKISKIPLPQLIEGEIREGIQGDLSALKAELATLVPQAVLEDHRTWEKESRHFMQGSLWVLATITVVVSIVVALTMGLVTYSGLIIHGNTIEVLDLVGASHDYIARQFQLYGLKLGLKGSVIGTIGALITLVALGEYPFFETLISVGFIILLTLIITVFASRLMVFKTLDKQLV